MTTMWCAQDSVSADACQKCPANTYGTVEGAKVEAECDKCPVGAVTNGTAQTSRTACSCVSSLYPITDATQWLLACRTCPDGAACLSDGSCALNSQGPAYACSNGPVIGTWNRAPSLDGPGPTSELSSYVLSGCPDGFRLINSTQRSSTGTFSHDRQACNKCNADSYIISPMFECQRCQAGLVCSGGREVTPLVLGAEVVPIGDTYWLAGCPTGYWRRGFNQTELSVASSAEILQQACIPCSVGEHCTEPQCFQCSTCPKGSYKDEESPSPCSLCPLVSLPQWCSVIADPSRKLPSPDVSQSNDISLCFIGHVWEFQRRNITHGLHEVPDRRGYSQPRGDRSRGMRVQTSDVLDGG